jgi:malate permease and related proteins
MSAILLLALCLGLGVAMARNPRLPAGTPAALNFWVIEVALPALVLVEIPKLKFSSDLLYLGIAPWLVFLGAVPLFSLLGRAFGWSRGSIGALILTCGLGNTSFMGLAMVEALRGREALGAAVVADQIGTFSALSVGGVIVAAVWSGESPHPRLIVKRLFSFAPFLAFLAALLLRQIGTLPEEINAVLHRLGQTVTPLALFSVGLQLRLRGFGDHIARLATGLAWKMALAPLVVAGVAAVLGLHGSAVTVGILQCAMAPMVTAGIIAEQHNLDPPLANLIVSVGTLLSMITVPLVSWLL